MDTYRSLPTVSGAGSDVRADSGDAAPVSGRRLCGAAEPGTADSVDCTARAAASSGPGPSWLAAPRRAATGGTQPLAVSIIAQYDALCGCDATPFLWAMHSPAKCL